MTIPVTRGKSQKKSLKFRYTKVYVKYTQVYRGIHRYTFLQKEEYFIEITEIRPIRQKIIG